jgi:hypothetical protein
MAKRKLFDEMIEGVRAMKGHGEGKITVQLSPPARSAA